MKLLCRLFGHKWGDRVYLHARHAFERQCQRCPAKIIVEVKR